MMATAHLSPGRLKDLLGAISVMVRAAIAASSEAMGTCCCRENVSSQWTSSAQIRSPRLTQISAMRWSSSLRKTRPTGLCGLQSRNIRVRSPIAASKRSKSIAYRPSGCRSSSISSEVSPTLPGTRRMGGYTGVWRRSPSPVVVSARAARLKPGMTPGMTRIASGDTRHP